MLVKTAFMLKPLEAQKPQWKMPLQTNPAFTKNQKDFQSIINHQNHKKWFVSFAIFSNTIFYQKSTN